MGGIARLYRTGRACCSWTLRETLPPLGRPMRHVSGAAAQQEVVAVSLNEEGTVRLGQELSRTLRAGDVYLIRGKVGAGKSALARAFIRSASEDDSLPVPSPTFLLVNCYDEVEDQPEIHHYDLYRTKGPEDLARLEVMSSFSAAVSLVEWPEAIPKEMLPAQGHLDVVVQALGRDEEDALARKLGMPERQRGAGVSAVLEDLSWREYRLCAVGAAWQERMGALQRSLASVGVDGGLVCIDRQE